MYLPSQEISCHCDYEERKKKDLAYHALDAVSWNRVIGHSNSLAYIGGCVVTGPAQLQRRALGYNGKPLKLHLLWIAVLKKASATCFCCTAWHGPENMDPSRSWTFISRVTLREGFTQWLYALCHHSEAGDAKMQCPKVGALWEVGRASLRGGRRLPQVPVPVVPKQGGDTRGSKDQPKVLQLNIHAQLRHRNSG